MSECIWGKKEKLQFWGLCAVTLERAGLGLILPNQIFFSVNVFTVLQNKLLYCFIKQKDLIWRLETLFSVKVFLVWFCLFFFNMPFFHPEKNSALVVVQSHIPVLSGERGEEESCWNLILWFVKLTLCSGNREIWKKPHFPAATAGHQASEGWTQILNILSVSVHFGEFSLGKGCGAGMWMCCSCGELGKQPWLFSCGGRQNSLFLSALREKELNHSWFQKLPQEPTEKQECREAQKD